MSIFHIIYLSGCVLSALLVLLWYRKEKYYFSKDEKILTLCIFLPFVTIVSWMGVLLVLFSQLGNFNDLEDK